MSFTIKPLTVKDLQLALARAIVEIIPLECYIEGSDAIKFFQNALDTEFPVAPEEIKEPSPIPSTPSSLEENFDTQSAYEVEDKPMNGREAVVYFMKCRHLRKPACAYFKHATSDVFRPYDLVSVRKDDAGPCHFLFSTFGVLQVYADRPAERLDLLDWEKEAVMWEILTKIPFFKYYYLRKSFSRWRQNVCRLKFARSKMNLSLRFLHCTPSYLLVLSHCQRLFCDFQQSIGSIFVETPYSGEPVRVEMLISRVTQSVETMRSTGKRLLGCCGDALNLLRTEMFGQLMTVQAELLKMQHYQSGKESLHIRRVRMEQFRGRLAKSWYEFYRIISLAVYIDHMIAGQLYNFIRDDIIAFLNVALPHRFKRVTAPQQHNNNEELLTHQDSRQHITRSPSSSTHDEGEQEWVGGSTASSVIMASDVPEPVLLKGLFICEISNDLKAGQLVSSPSEDEVLTTIANLLQFIGKTVDECAEPFRFSTQHLLEGFRPLSVFPETVKLSYFPSEIAGGGPPPYDCLIPVDPRVTTATEPLFVRITINLQQEILRICPDWIPSCSMKPLSGQDLMFNITQNSNFDESFVKFSNAIKSSFEEVESFVEAHQWLAEICTFIENWNDAKTKSLLASNTREIEEVFRVISQYRERVAAIDPSFTAGGENKMLFVTAENLAERVIRSLDQIYSSLTEAFRATTLSHLVRLTGHLESLINLLENPPQPPAPGSTDKQLALFSHFSAKIAECRKSKGEFDIQLVRLRADMNLLRTLGAAGSSDDAAIEMSAVQAFEKFVKRLQDSVPIVSKQTDLTLHSVKARLEELRDACYGLFLKATSGEFVEAETDAATSIGKLAKIIGEYDSIYVQIEELWFFHDSMSEEGLLTLAPSSTARTTAPATTAGEMTPSGLVTMAENSFIPGEASLMGESHESHARHIFIEWRKAIEVRRELWHYLLQASQLIEDWIHLPIKKLPFVLIEDKLNAWNIVGLQIEETLVSQPDDAVLKRFSDVLDRCRRLLVFASKIHNPLMNDKFLRRLYGRLSLSFDWRREEYTLADWELLWNDSGHVIQQCLDIVHDEALAEAAAIKKLDRLANYWDEYGIQVSTCVIGTAVIRSAQRSARSAASQRASSARVRSAGKEKFLDFNVLAEFESFRLAAEKTKAEIQSIFTNVITFDDKIRYGKALPLLKRLDYFGEFMSLAEKLQFACQFFLASIDVASRNHFIDDYVADKTRAAITEWQGLVNMIVDKPRFLSWPEKDRKSIEAAFQRLFELINGTIETHFGKYFDFVRVRSPRLFALTNWEIVMLTAHIQVGGNASGLKAIGTFLAKCFPHVTGLISVTDEENPASAFTSVPLIDGLLLCFGERLSFNTVIPVSPIPEVLIASIEDQIQQSVLLGISESVLELEKSPDGVFSKDFVATHSSQSLTIAQSTKFGRKFAKKDPQLVKEICNEIDYYARQFLTDTLCKPENFTKAKNLMAQLIYQRDFVATTRGELGEFSGLYHSCSIKSTTPVTKNEVCIADLTLQTGGMSPAIPYLFEPICCECWSSTALLTPELARALSVTLVQTSYVTQFSMIDGNLFSGRTHSIRTLANLAGRPFFSVDCSVPKTYDSIRSVLATSVTLGSLVVFREVDSLPATLYGQLSSLLTNLRLSISNLFSSALRVKKEDSDLDAGRPLSSRGKSATTPLRSRRSSANAAMIAASIGGLTRSSIMLLNPENTATTLKERLSTLAESESESFVASSSEPDEVIDFDGLLLSSAVNVIPQPLIFCTFSKPIITGLRLSLRQLILPGSSLTINMQQVLAVNLTSAGFLNAEDLSRKTALVIQRVHDKLPEFEQWGLLHSWRFAGIVSSIAAVKRMKELKQTGIFSDEIQLALVEEMCIVRSVHVLLSSRLNGEKQEEIYKDIVRDVFANSTTRPGSGAAFGFDPFLVDAIEAVLKHLHLDCSLSQIAKILQLHTALNSSTSKQAFDPVIITGLPGSGKSTVINVLAAVFNGLVENTRREIDSLDSIQQNKLSKALPWGMRNPLGLANQTIKVLKDVPPVDDQTLFTRLQKLKHILAGGLYSTLESLKGPESSSQPAEEAANKPDSAASSEDAMPNAPGVQSVVSIFECCAEEDGTMLAREIRQRFPRILHQQQIWVKLNAMYPSADIEPLLRAWCDDRLQLRAGGGVRLVAELSASVMAKMSPGSLGSLVVINCSPPNWTCLLVAWRLMATNRWLMNNSELEWIFMHICDVFEAISEFSASYCTKSWVAPGGSKLPSYRLHEATIFLTYLSTCFDYVIPREKFVDHLAKLGPGCIVEGEKLEYLLSGYRDRVKACLVFSIVHTFLQSVQPGDVAKLAEFTLRKLQSTTYSSALPEGIQSSQLHLLAFRMGGDGLTGLTPYPDNAMLTSTHPMDLPLLFSPVGSQNNAEDVFVRLSRCSGLQSLQLHYWLLDFLQAGKCAGNLMMVFEPGLSVRHSLMSLASSNPEMMLKIYKIAPRIAVSHMLNGIEKLVSMKSASKAKRFVYAVDDLCAICDSDEPQVVRSLTAIASSASHLPGIQDSPRSFSKLLLLWNSSMSRSMPFELLRHFLPITLPTPPASSILAERYSMQTIQWGMSAVTGRYAIEAPKVRQLVELLLQSTAEVYELIRQRVAVSSQPSPFSFTAANLSMFFSRLLAYPTRSLSSKQVHTADCQDTYRCSCVRRSIVHLWRNELIVCLGQRFINQHGDWFTEVVNQCILTRLSRWPNLLSKQSDLDSSQMISEEFQNDDDSKISTGLQEPPFLSFLFANIRLPDPDDHTKMIDQNRVFTHNDLKRRLVALLNQLGSGSKKLLDERLFIQLSDDVTVTVERLMTIISRPQSRLLLLATNNQSLAPSWRPLVMLSAAALSFEFVDLSIVLKTAQTQLQAICKAAATTRREFVVRLSHSCDQEIYKLAIAVAMCPSTSGILGDWDQIVALTHHVDPATDNVDWLDRRIRENIRFVFCPTPLIVSPKAGSYFAEIADLFRPLQHRLYVLNCQLDPNCLPQVVDCVMAASQLPESLYKSLTVNRSLLVECYECAISFLAAKFPLLPPNAYERTFSRLSFASFLHVFQSLYAEMYSKIKEELDFYENALERLRLGVHVAETMSADMSGVKSQIEQAWTDFKNSKKRAEDLREELIKAEALCREAEEEVARLKIAEDEAENRLRTKLAVANPHYEAAVAALQDLNKADVEEFRSYRDPSQYIVNIVNALCVLFNRPEKWESGKLLLISVNIFEMLEFYPKNDIPDDMFERLGAYVNKPDFTPPIAEIYSKAARSICSWVLSIYKYATIYRQMQPLIAERRKAGEEYEAAKRLLGRRRVNANNIRADLEAEIARAKRLKRTAASLEQQIRDLERDLQRTREIVGILINFRSDVEFNIVDYHRQRLEYAAIDSMFTAAAMQFGGLLGYRETTSFLENLACRAQLAQFDSKRFVTDWQQTLVARTVQRKMGEHGQAPAARNYQSSLETFLLNESEMSSLIVDQQMSDVELRHVLLLDICLRHSPTNWPLLIGPSLLAKDILNTWSGTLVTWHSSPPARVIEMSVLDQSKFSLQSAIEAAKQNPSQGPVVVLITNFENALEGSDANQLEQILAYTNRLNNRCGDLLFAFQTELPFHLLVHWDSQITLDRFCIIRLNPLSDIFGTTRDLMASAPRPELTSSRDVNARELVNQLVNLRSIRLDTCNLIIQAPENLLADGSVLNAVRHTLSEVDRYCASMSYFGMHRQEHLIANLEAPFVDAARQLTVMYEAISDSASLSPVAHLPVSQFFDCINTALADLVMPDNRVPTAQLKQLSMRIYRQVMCRIMGLLRSAFPDNLLRQTLTCMHCRATMAQSWLRNTSKRSKSDVLFPFTPELARYRFLFGFTEKLFGQLSIELEHYSLERGTSRWELVNSASTWIEADNFKLLALAGRMFKQFEGVYESICSDSVGMWREYFAQECAASIFTMVDESMLALDPIDRCLLWILVVPKHASKVVDSLLAADFGPYLFQAADYAPSPKLSSAFLVLEAENSLQAFDAMSWMASKTTKEKRETSANIPSQSFTSSIHPFEHISCAGGSASHLVEQMIERHGHDFRWALLLLNVDQIPIGHTRSKLNQFVKYSKKQIINSESISVARRRTKRMSIMHVTPVSNEDKTLSMLDETEDEKQKAAKAAFFATIDADVAGDSQAQRRVPTWLLISARRLCIKPNTTSTLTSHSGTNSWPGNLTRTLMQKSLLNQQSHLTVVTEMKRSTTVDSSTSTM